MRLRVSRDECSKDRFTQEEIIGMVSAGETVMSGDRDHCLCRKSDGAVLAEIERYVE